MIQKQQYIKAIQHINSTINNKKWAKKELNQLQDLKVTAAILSGNAIQSNVMMDYQILPTASQLDILKFNYPLLLLKDKLQLPKLINDVNDRQLYYAMAIQNKQLDKLQYACVTEKMMKAQGLEYEPRIKVAYQLQIVFNQLLQNSKLNIQPLTDSINELIKNYEKDNKAKEIRTKTQEYRLHREHILGLITNCLEFYAMHFSNQLKDIKNVEKYVDLAKDIKPRLYYLLKYLLQTDQDKQTIDDLKQYLEKESQTNDEIKQFLHHQHIQYPELLEKLLSKQELSQEEKDQAKKLYPIALMCLQQTHESHQNYLNQVTPCNHLWVSQLILELAVELKQDISTLLPNDQEKLQLLSSLLTQNSSIYNSQYWNKQSNYNIINNIIYANAILSEEVTSCLLNLQKTITDSYNMYLSEQFIDFRQALTSNEAKFISAWISMKNIVTTLSIDQDNCKEYKLKLFEQLISMNGSQQILSINNSLFDNSAIYNLNITDDKEIKLYQEQNQKVKQCKPLQQIDIKRNQLFDYIYEYTNQLKSSSTQIDLLAFQLFATVKYMQMATKGEDTQCIQQYVKDITSKQNSQTEKIMYFISQQNDQELKKLVNQLEKKTVQNYIIDFMLLTTYCLIFDKKELYQQLQQFN